MVEHLGAPDGVLVFDETGDIKKGCNTVGVARQSTGVTGQVEEIRHLLATTVLRLDRGIRFVLRWSCWGRRHQARAELSHYQRRGELRDHPSYRMITDRNAKDQLQVLL